MKRTLLILPLLGMFAAQAQVSESPLVQALGEHATAMGRSAAYATVLLDEEPEAEFELVSFEASSTGTDGVLLRWTATNETPGDIYRAERSADRLTWFPAETIAVTRTKEGYSAHQTIDRNPFNGVSYYRLMRVNTHGEEEEVSDLFSVRHDLGSDLVIHQDQAPGHFVVLASGTISDMQLLNNRGQFVPMDLFLDGERVRVNAELLPAGTYYVQAVVNGKRTMRPVIIGNGTVVGG